MALSRIETTARSMPPVDVCAVCDGDDGGRAGLLVQSIDEAVGAPPGYPLTVKLEAQWLAEPLRVLGDSRQHLGDRCRVLLWQSFDAASGGAGKDEPPGSVAHLASR